jgi:hypothetical protein
MSFVDYLKVFQRLDEQDPRINPIPTNTATPRGEIAYHRRRAVDLLLSIFTDKEADPKKPIQRTRSAARLRISCGC